MIITGVDTENTMTRCLCLIRHDGEFLAQQCIEQSALADIGQTDEGNESRFVVLVIVEIVGRFFRFLPQPRFSFFLFSDSILFYKRRDCGFEFEIVLDFSIPSTPGYHRIHTSISTAFSVHRLPYRGRRTWQAATIHNRMQFVSCTTANAFIDTCCIALCTDGSANSDHCFEYRV